MSDSGPVSRRRSVLGESAPTPTVGVEPATTAAPSVPVKSRRLSKIVVLGLLGVGAVAGGSLAYDWFNGDDEQQVATQRNGYDSREECEKNYSAQQCTPDRTYRSGIGFVPIFWGPYYHSSPSFFRSSADPGPGRASIGSVVQAGPSVSARGGFGSSAARSGGSAAS